MDSKICTIVVLFPFRIIIIEHPYDVIQKISKIKFSEIKHKNTTKMIKPEKSLNEEERLNLLESYAILDTLPEEV
jgi:hypothetical protein